MCLRTWHTQHTGLVVISRGGLCSEATSTRDILTGRESPSAGATGVGGAGGRAGQSHGHGGLTSGGVSSGGGLFGGGGALEDAFLLAGAQSVVRGPNREAP